MEKTAVNKETAQVLSPQEFLDHWQGHRRLTRKVIEAFPEKDLFSYSIGGMRPFAQMVAELLAIAAPGIEEIVSGVPQPFEEGEKFNGSKDVMLQKWDETTEVLERLVPEIGIERYGEKLKLFGQYEGTVISSILYFIDNEIHHRGQGYVYLRALGLEPPAFWER